MEAPGLGRNLLGVYLRRKRGEPPFREAVALLFFEVAPCKVEHKYQVEDE